MPVVVANFPADPECGGVSLLRRPLHRGRAPPYLYVRITRASPLHLLHVHTQAAEGSLIHRLPLLNNTPAPRADDPIAPVIRAVEISLDARAVFSAVNASRRLRWRRMERHASGEDHGEYRCEHFHRGAQLSGNQAFFDRKTGQGHPLEPRSGSKFGARLYHTKPSVAPPLGRALAIVIGISGLFLTGLIAGIAVHAMRAALTDHDTG